MCAALTMLRLNTALACVEKVTRARDRDSKQLTYTPVSYTHLDVYKRQLLVAVIRLVQFMGKIKTITEAIGE